MRSLPVAVLLLLAVALTSARNWRHNSRRFQPPCCVKYTTTDMSSNVIGDTYRQPPVSAPCVDAFVLTTSDGPLCVDPNSEWVEKLTANMTKL
eukprot:XP_011606425.1 PREDICTED: C-C motif chemokine 18-like [Takifugu rubripes]